MMKVTGMIVNEFQFHAQEMGKHGSRCTFLHCPPGRERPGSLQKAAEADSTTKASTQISAPAHQEQAAV